MKKSVIKYFLIANNINIHKEKKEIKITSSYSKIASFLKHKEFTSCKQSTLKDYKTKIENFYKIYSEINQENVKEFLHYKKITVKSAYINLFAQYFKFHNMEFNLCYSKKDLKKEKLQKTKDKLLTTAEIKKLINYINKLSENDYETKAIFTLYIYTGCRLSELKNAKFSNLDLKTKELTVTGKGDKKRIIYLNSNPELYKFLKLHHKRCKEILKKRDLPILHNIRLQPMSDSYIQKKVKEIFKKLGFDDNKSIHSLRHNFGTILYNNGVSLPSIQKILGHSDIKTTEIYVELSTQTKKEIKGRFKV